MAWIYLLFAGAFEIGFTSCLKLSESFTKLWPTLGFLIFAAFSFAALSYSLKTIPLGTSYAIWTGIGASGTALVGILFFGESADVWRLFFLLCLIGSIIGLKMVTPDIS